jgi:hypothetical protein
MQLLTYEKSLASCNSYYVLRIRYKALKGVGRDSSNVAAEYRAAWVIH